MRNLLTPRWMLFKAVLFVVLAGMAGGLLVWQNPTLATAVCVAVVAWACSRAYYFAFYVIEKYVDSSFRFAGLGAAVVWLWRRRLCGSGAASRSGRHEEA